MSTVDVDFDTDVWVGVPREWTGETWTHHRDWAREVAEIVWTGARPHRGRPGVDHLALGLALLAESPVIAPGRHTYLWLPEPMAELLPVHLDAFVAEGEAEEALRDLVRAHPAGAVEAPIVEPFDNPHLGEGLRALCYAIHPEDDAVVLTLSYAWRVGDTDVRLWLSTFDTGLALRAMDDVDDLARGIHLAGD